MARRTCCGILLAGLFAQAAAGEGVVIEMGPLRVGQATAISVCDAGGNPFVGAAMRVTFRPGSKVEAPVDLGVTDAEGILAWTPQMAGIVRIEASKEVGGGKRVAGEKTAAVCYAELPAASLLVLVAAGAILFGGIAWSFHKLRGGVPADADQAGGDLP